MGDNADELQRPPDKAFFKGVAIKSASYIGGGGMSLKVKFCRICVSEFVCGSPFECWCSSIKLSREQLEMLKERADDCVCPDCLRKAAASRKST